MDTKLKKSRMARPLYIIAFVLCVASFIAVIIGVIGVVTLDDTRLAFEPDADIVEAFQNRIALCGGIAAGAGIIMLITFIYLAVATGKRDPEENIRLNGFDKIFTEIQLFAIGFMAIWGGFHFVALSYEVIRRGFLHEDAYSFYFPLSVLVTFTVAFGLAAAAVGLAFILSCIKKIKAGVFIKQSICGWLAHKIYKEIYLGGSTMQKVVAIALLVCLLSATIFLVPVILVLILVFAPKWVRKYDEVKKGIKEVSNGNLDYKIPVEGQGELDNLARGINEISAATNQAVQNELKNQRMKTDLISNVSHDLKTPLTSMVTYIDLLKAEGLKSKNAPEYLDVLERKTNQLRHLTEDLFEAAKASSGAIPVHMETVDLLSLVNQGLGELGQQLEDTQLEFIITAPQEHYYVHADGQLLWRVVENLLGNAIKYSQEGTRVYMNLYEEESSTYLEIKNISKQSLNINPEELMERFKRGDESRTTEGSGLGLAIAKDFIKLMEGHIDIAIDGDLFKAKVSLATREAPPQPEPEPEEEPEE